MTKRLKIDFKAWPEVKHLTQQLKAARENAGLTQLQVAKILGTAQPYIASLENGYSNPTFQLLAQLTRLYKIPLTDLMTDKVINRRVDHPKRGATKSAEEQNEKGATE